MFSGDNTIEMILGVTERYMIEQTDADIADHQRQIANLKRKKRLTSAMLAVYRRNQAKAKKRMEVSQKKFNKSMRKRAKAQGAMIAPPLPPVSVKVK